ncbi:hypothetical protein GQ457_03G012900 [Hibiscus cannabinus]
MNVIQVFHMNQENDDTRSIITTPRQQRYRDHGIFKLELLFRTQHLINYVRDCRHSTSNVWCRPLLEFRLFLNYLYSNDFNYLFMSLPTFIKRLKEDKDIEETSQCFISGVPRSFNGRLFPTNNLHFIYSFSNFN